MVNECAIGWDNRIDTATLTVTNQVSTMLVDNLKTEDVRELWRAANNTVAIRADFGGSINWGGTALVHSNAVAGDTWRIGLSTSDATGLARDVYDSGTIAAPADPAFGMLVHFPPTPKVGRHLRIDLTQTNAPEAGRWFAGPVWFPSRAFSFGWRPPWRDASRRSESLGQVIYIDRKIRQRGMQFALRGITETEWETEVNELNRICGTSRDILICKDISNANLGRVSIWGLQERPAEASQPEENPDFWVVDIEAWERL